MIEVILGFISGIFLGSLIKALADRSLKNVTFLGRSRCEFCKKSLFWFDLIPVFSYFFLKGRCRFCHKKLSVEYLLAEILMGILIGFLFWHSFSGSKLTFLQLFNNFQLLGSFKANSIVIFQSFSFLSDLLFKTFFISVLCILFLTDIKDMFIPDRIVIPAIKITFFYLLFLTVLKIGYLYYYLTLSPIGQKLLPPYSDYFQTHAQITAEPLTQGILMAVLIAGFFMALIIITRGRGMGGGDVKLGALIGLSLGLPNSLIALVLAFFTGAVFSLFLILFGRKHFGQTIAFGPFLVLGSISALFFGNEILNWYLHLAV